MKKALRKSGQAITPRHSKLVVPSFYLGLPQLALSVEKHVRSAFLKTRTIHLRAYPWKASRKSFRQS